jgi:hypothetical protein
MRRREAWPVGELGRGGDSVGGVGAERELAMGSGPRLGGYEVPIRDRRHAPAQKENAARGAALAVPAVPGKPT